VALPVLVSGASVSCATACTNPLDVLKVRLQVLDPTRSGTPPPRGMGDALGRLLRNEGPLALWKGLTPSLARAMCYGGLRLGLYQPILGAVESARGGATKSSAPSVGRPGGAWEATARSKRKGDAFVEPDREQTDDDGRFRFANGGDVASKVSAGAASGAFAAFLLNPTELVKTRLMAARDDHTKNVSAWSCASTIVRERGVKGLWRGAAMSTTRSAALTASQCAAYDSAKSFVRKWRRGEEDDLLTHLCASMLTGLVTTTVTNPVDMIKTQLYVSSPGPNSTKLSASRVRAPGGAAEAARDVLRREGPRGFMRGWTANYLRLGPQTVITFVALEQLRKLVGMDAL
jgi:solute carrier family 25 uncoupling protein 8/9